MALSVRRSGPATLFLEAVLHLLLARLAVALLPFAALKQLLRATPQRSLPDPPVLRVCGAVGCAGGPLRASCLSQAIAAHWMLARRGVPSRICFGVKRVPGGLRSHAWLACGDAIVLGGESVREFAPLAEFPVRPEGDAIVRNLGTVAARR